MKIKKFTLLFSVFWLICFPGGTAYPATYDATGTWSWSSNQTSNCGWPPELQTGTAIINQTGDAFTISYYPYEPPGNNFSAYSNDETIPLTSYSANGTINNGNIYSWTATYPDGTETWTDNCTITLSSPTSATGSCSWTLSDSSSSCSGTDSFTSFTRSFSTSDLEGTWNVHTLRSGAASWWSHGTFVIDGSGNVTPQNVIRGDTEGSFTINPFTYSITSSGIITHSAISSFHGFMSQDKSLIVSTFTSGGGSVYILNILQKAGGTFTTSDLAGTWYKHRLTSGSNDDWAYGTEVIDVNGNGVETEFFKSTGNAIADLTYTLTIDINGIITRSDDSTWHGVMSQDKNLIVLTKTTGSGTSYRLQIMQKAGGTFSTSDLAGTWYKHRLTAGSNDDWAYGTEVIGFNGYGIETEFFKSTGNAIADLTYTLTIDINGIITRSDDSTWHGVMSQDKNLIVLTKTTGSGTSYRLQIYQKGIGKQYTAGGTYSYDSGSGVLILNFASSDFVCDGPSIGTEQYTIPSITETSLVLVEDTGQDTWTRESGTAGDIVGTWFESDGIGQITINSDNSFSYVSSIDCEDSGTTTTIIYNGHTYALTTNNLTWNAAKTLAEESNGYLVTVNDAAENQLLIDNYSTGSSAVWIGFNDIALEGTFVWANGESASYTNWYTNEPNDASGEDCGSYDFLLDQNLVGWNDLDCSIQNKAIVEWNSPGGVDTTDTTPPTTTASPADGTYTSVQSVTLSCSDNSGGSGCAATYYTTDGSTPTTSSTVYSGAITISTNTTLKFFSKDNAGNSESVKTGTYVIDTVGPTINITSPSDGLSTSRIIEITGTASDTGSGVSRVELKITNGTYYVTSQQWLTRTETWVTLGGTDSWIFNTSLVNWIDGAWTITARATDGVGNNTNTPITVTIATSGTQQAYTTLNLDLSSQTILQNGTINATGKLTRLPDTGTDLSGLTINLTITAPDGSQTTNPTTTYNSLGHYRFDNLSGFTQKGTYILQTSFEETSALAASVSEAMPVLAGASAGYAVIVEGKITNDEGLDSHNKTSNRMYKTLKKRGFIDQNIYYFNYDTSQTGITVDALPSKSGIQTAIETWAKDKMNGSPAPLYVIMVDHGNVDTFYINNEEITPNELNSWLNTLESGLNKSASSEKRIIIYGACYSGSFIPTLSKSGRVIVTSAAADEESYKGPLEPDNIRSGEYFLEEFFKDLGRGYSIRESFKIATDKTEKFTRKGGGSANTNNRYFDSAMQHPLLDDNGDGAGKNVLSDSGGDGQIAQDIYLGTGVTYDTNSVANPAEIVDVTDTLYLDSSTSSGLMWASSNDDSQVSSAWMEIRLPSKTLAAAGGTVQLNIDLTKELMTLNGSTSRWEKTYSSFTESGMYEVFYFVRDTETLGISPTKRSVVYKNKAGNNAPAAFDLTSPDNGSEQKTVLVFGWNATSDPDGDSVTYNLLIATDQAFSNIVYKKEEINTTTTYVDADASLLDLTTYYWKVQTVDAYGAKTDSTQTWVFNTNNTNAFPAIITGIVYNSADFSPLEGTSLTTDQGGADISIGGGVYIMIVPSGTINITSSYTGYSDKTVRGVSTNSGKTTIVNIPMTANVSVDTTTPTTTATPASGIYSSAQSVTLACDDGNGSGCAATYYTTDGTTPTTSSSQHNSALTISGSTTIKYFSTDNLGNREKTKKADYFIIPTGTAALSVSPPSLAFGSSTTEMNISVSNIGGGRMEWSATSDSDWFTIKNSNGLTEGIADQRVVSVNRSGLSAGDYTGTITIDAGSTGSDTISVTMTVSNSPVLSYAPPQIDFGHLRTQASLNITNKGTGTLNWSVSESLSWLTFDVSSGSTTTEKDTVTMTINRSLPTLGENTGTIDISDGTTTTQITVTAYKPDSAVSFTSMTTDPSNMDADGSSTSLITATFSSTCTSVTFSTELGSFGTATSTATSGVATATYTASSVEGIAVIMAECNGVYGAGTVNLNNISFTNAETEIPGTGATTVDKRSTTGLSMEKSGFGTPPVTLATYSFNPGNTFSNVPVGNYFDANLGGTDDVDSVTIKKWVTAEDISGISEFKKMTLGLYYANGTVWEACSNTGYMASPSSSYVGYIYATFTDSTSPSIDYLDGLPLVAGEEAAIPIPTLFEWGVVALLILLLISGIFVMVNRRKHAV